MHRYNERDKFLTIFLLFQKMIFLKFNFESKINYKYRTEEASRIDTLSKLLSNSRLEWQTL